MTPRTLIILGHPSATSFCSALAETYIQAAKTAGHEVRVLRLGELTFDPVLQHGYTHIQALEPDLLSAQSDIFWATHLTCVSHLVGWYACLDEGVYRPNFPARLCL